MNTPDYITIAIFADLVNASRQRVRAQARRGTFKKAAVRAPDGSWLLDREPALRAWDSNRDLSTAPLAVVVRESERVREAKRAAVAAPQTEEVMVWEGAGGRYEAPIALARALEAAWANPDQPLMNQALIEAADRILIAVGQLAPDFPVGCPIEVEPQPEGGAS